ncbi:glycosyltransferase family 2 protein [Chamaesiphon sp. VAR_48_metabat_403]|uniref:glycosyltransferase family 2 protein n=1 Tax=Chamaesiphon sp. VAR_48_metabat_403 TaxID=2964700 RepID=UPI00286D7783|nr:glycosyltransferase family 2 protein [Chamaesiphon sp. VAR_48_metabat_403]
MLNYQAIDRGTNSAEYLLFVNSLDSNLKIVEIVSIYNHPADRLQDWMGVKSIVCMNDRDELYDIDIRLAWGSEIFRQHRYDYGWNQSTLLCRSLRRRGYANDRRRQPRHKLIVYLCTPATHLGASTDRSVPAEFIIGKYWQSIHHYYLPLPQTLPFELPEPITTADRLHLDLDLPTIVSTKPGIREGGLRTKGIERRGTVDRPLISVITVVYNGASNLEQTIQSVLNQDCQNFEYIIIDGGSTDGTIEIVEKYADRIDYWMSGRDAGLYDAMNRGIDLAAGEWLNFMNCGDFFTDSRSLSRVPLQENVDFYYSDTILYDGMGIIKLRVCSKERQDVIHQSIVYNKRLHSNYKYLVHDKLSISDYFFFRKYDAKNWCKLDSPIAIYNTEGISVTNSKGFVQRLFVEFMAGDINEFQMSLAIMAKVLRTPLRIIRDRLK